MSATTQIVQLKRLALNTSRHLPHNEHYLNARIYYQRFEASNKEPDKEFWLHCFYRRNVELLDSLDHLIERDIE